MCHKTGDVRARACCDARRMALRRAPSDGYTQDIRLELRAQSNYLGRWEQRGLHVRLLLFTPGCCVL